MKTQMHNIDNVYSNTIKTLYLDIRSFKTQNDCDKIINPIKSNYESLNDFILVLETRNLQVQDIKLKCLYIFSYFINSLKVNEFHYLKKTVIYIYNKHCFDLLYCLFTHLCEPIAVVEVFLYKNVDMTNKLSNPINMSNVEKIKKYYPRTLKN
jgi:hypothetical protein